MITDCLESGGAGALGLVDRGFEAIIGVTTSFLMISAGFGLDSTKDSLT